MVPQKHIEPSVRPDTLTIPELEQSKAAVLNTLASVHSRLCLAKLKTECFRVALDVIVQEHT